MPLMFDIVQSNDPERTRYRVLMLTFEGAIVDNLPLSARNDDEAIGIAKSMVDGHAIELWDGVRFIDHFPSVD